MGYGYENALTLDDLDKMSIVSKFIEGQIEKEIVSDHGSYEYAYTDSEIVSGDLPMWLKITFYYCGKELLTFHIDFTDEADEAASIIDYGYGDKSLMVPDNFAEEQVQNAVWSNPHVEGTLSLWDLYKTVFYYYATAELNVGEWLLSGIVYQMGDDPEENAVLFEMGGEDYLVEGASIGVTIDDIVNNTPQSVYAA